jgi:NDP-sugar pyrophosphorylase family protein
MKAMLFAAGLGTRLGGLTANKPKALVEVNGKPLLYYAIEYLKKYEITDIIINVHHFAEQIINYVKQNNNFDINIEFSDESGRLLETGGGLLKAKHFFADTNCFVVYNTDIYTSLNLNEAILKHKNTNALATLVVRNRKTSRYLLFSDKNVMCGWENTITGEQIVTRKEKNISKYAFSGVQVLSTDIFELLESKENTKFSITKAYIELSGKNKIVGYVDNSKYWIDAGKPEALSLLANIIHNSN